MQTPSHFLKSRQRIIDDINFLVYRTSLHFLDIDSHKKLDFVLIPISMSWSIFLSHVRCIRKREFYISCVMKQQHPEKLLHLYGSQWTTQVLDSINMPLCNNVLDNVKNYCNHYIATHCNYKMPSLGGVINIFHHV